MKFNYKKPDNLSRFALRRKASEKFSLCAPSGGPRLSKRKINKPLFFSFNAQFFVEACKKFIKYFRHSNNCSTYV